MHLKSENPFYLSYSNFCDYSIAYSKKIDNEDITNKAVKQMRYCLDKKGYTIEMIDCFNKSYTDEDKKILLSLLNHNMQ
jgi:hypothetical protein